MHVTAWKLTLSACWAWYIVASLGPCTCFLGYQWMIEGHQNNAITHLYHNSGYQFAIDPALNEHSAHRNSAAADTDSATTGLQGAVDGLDGLRQLGSKIPRDNFLMQCRSMAIQIPISKPFIFSLSLSQPPNSTQQDHPSSSPVVDHSTTLTTSNPALPIDHHAAFGARRSTTRTHKLRIRIWKSAHSILAAKCSPWLVGGVTSIW